MKREPYSTVTYDIQQIMPAPPDAVAVFTEGEHCWGDPIIAWGVFDSVERHYDETGKCVKVEKTREAGPLVLSEVCSLEPPWTSSNFAGVRIGAKTWVRLGESTAIEEPADSPFRGFKPIE